MEKDNKKKRDMSTVHITITPSLKQMIEQIKTETHKSYSGILIDLATEEVENHEKKDKKSKI